MTAVAPRLYTSARPAGLSRRARTILLALQLFVAVDAFYGGYSLLTDAEGFGMKESWLNGTPFSSYTVPAIVLIVAIGGGMLAAAAVTLVGTDRQAAMAAFAMGITLIVWLVVETVMVGYQGSTQVVLLAIMEIPALVLIWIGWRARRRTLG